MAGLFQFALCDEVLSDAHPGPPASSGLSFNSPFAMRSFRTSATIGLLWLVGGFNSPFAMRSFRTSPCIGVQPQAPAFQFALCDEVLSDLWTGGRCPSPSVFQFALCDEVLSDSRAARTVSYSPEFQFALCDEVLSDSVPGKLPEVRGFNSPFAMRSFRTMDYQGRKNAGWTVSIRPLR